MRFGHLVAWIVGTASIVLMLAVPAQAREERWLGHDGLERSYLIEVPGVRGQEPLPLVVLLHGGTQSASRVWRQTALPELAELYGFILAAPNAVDGHWNDHRSVYFGTNSPPIADDVGFVAAVIEDIVARDGANPRRVYVVGASNGGFMSFRIACELSETVAAIGAVIAGMLTAPETYCQPSVPVPVIMIAGTADPFIPFTGGVETVRGQTAEPILSIPDTARFWAANNGCSLSPTIVDIVDRNRRDRTTVDHWSFDACTSTAPVLLFIVEGGGHMWPTTGRLPTGSRLATALLGPVNRDIDSSTVLWTFFSQFSR